MAITAWHREERNESGYIELNDVQELEIYLFGAGGGGGGTAHATGDLVLDKTGWGGGGGSGGYSHLVRYNLSPSKTYRVSYSIGSGGAAGTSVHGTGEQNAVSGEDPSIDTVVRLSEDGTQINELYAYHGYKGVRGRANASAFWEENGAGGAAGSGMEYIDDTRTSGDYGAGGAGEGEKTGPNAGGSISTGEISFTINSYYKITLSNYGKGGCGGPNDGGTIHPDAGSSGYVVILYSTIGPYTAEATVSPENVGSVTISKTSNIHYKEIVTFRAETTNSAYMFSHWSDNCIDPVHQIAVKDNISLVANFGSLGDIIDDCPFTIVFSSGGGTFNTSYPPNITITSPSSGTSTPTLYYGSNMWVWAYKASASEKEMTIRVNIVDMVQNMTAPAGMESNPTFELVTPYQVLYTPSDSSDPQYHDITFKRTSYDQIRQYTAYPRWSIARDGPQRCVITAPVLGSLDFGNIQNIKETYTSSLTSYPTIVWGYTHNFCIDMGVSKKVTIDYIRVNPVNPDDDDDNTDSRTWSNAHWIKKFKEFTDRWQMRTNGCLLYLKRPGSENGLTENDPMSGHYPEIVAENAYITSAPINYDNISGQRIQNSVTFTIGTLYPQQEPSKMCQVTYKCLTTDGWSISGNEDVIINYPCNSLVQVPGSISKWKDDISGSTIKIWEGWHAVDPHSIVDGYLGIGVDETSITIYSYIGVYESTKYAVAEITESSTKTITWGSGTKVVYFYAVGAGGGGGGASIAEKYEVPVATEPYIVYITGAAGGGGGSSGGSAITKLTGFTDNTTNVNFTIGSGGSGGAPGTVSAYSSGKAAGSDGGSGGATYIDINGSRLMTVHGGSGGKGAPVPYSVDMSTVSCTGGKGSRIDSTAYYGGDGGGYKWTYKGQSSDDHSVDNGSNGKRPETSSSSAGGIGGGTYKYHTYSSLNGQQTALSGGGGGGGIPDDYSRTSAIIVHGGDGDGSDNRDGNFGGGGGGGFYKVTNRTQYSGGNGGSGGSGYAVMIVIGGTIS